MQTVTDSLIPTGSLVGVSANLRHPHHNLALLGARGFSSGLTWPEVSCPFCPGGSCTMYFVSEESKIALLLSRMIEKIELLRKS